MRDGDEERGESRGHEIRALPGERAGPEVMGPEAVGSRLFEAEWLYAGGRFRRDWAFRVDARGRIDAIGPCTSLSRDEGEPAKALRGAVVPGAVNAHSHAFQILLRGRADGAADFRDWVDNQMYPLALAIDAEGIAASARLAFAEMLKNGVTAVGEFFYLHNAPAAEECRPLGNANSELVIEAARSVGIRIHLLRCLYDRADKPGQRRFHEPVDVALASTRELSERWHEDDLVTVAIAPHSLHGATPQGIVSAAALAAELEMPFQIHLAEEEHDLAFARREYGTTPGRALEELGVISERLCIVHGVWLDTEEIELLGDAGARCAYNPISNMALGDGVTDIPAMVDAGVIVALGCDGPGANHQVNVWQEMRFAEWLQRVTRRRMNVLPSMGASAHEPVVNSCFEMGTTNGGRALGISVGTLAEGMWADFAVLDLDDLSLLPHHGPDPEALVHNVVNAMAARGAVRDVFVGGEQVVRDRALVRTDEKRLAAELAAATDPS